MYHPIKDGTIERIYQYDCWVPPVGYGKNVVTGALEYIGIHASAKAAKDQLWTRLELPADYAKKRQKEERQQAADSEYFDPYLESIRQQHWRHRLCGYWYYNNGQPTYITGLHWYYLNWVQIDIGYPLYRDNDRKFFYVWRYCEEDDRCGGLVHAARRREGKTYKGGAILLEYISRTPNVNAGIQSKTASDAKGVFHKAIVNVFKKMPEMFRPVFDTSGGVTPTSVLRFSKTTKKGAKALDDIDKPELDSYIDHKSSDIFAYDGTKQSRHLEDEVGKSTEVDVYERWQVNRFCSDQDGTWVGKNLLTTTVEEMENGGEAFLKIWKASDTTTRDKNGRTQSGLYRLFLPAHETTLFDKYGLPRTEEAKQYYLNQREGLASDPHALSSIIRKNPLTEEEMFRIDGDHCHFDAMKLNDQRDFLSWNKDVTERGNFEWEGGIRDSKVVWVPYKHGRWEIARGFNPLEGEVNNTVKRGEQFFPQNSYRFGSGCDPFDHRRTEDNRRSDGTALVKQKCNLKNFEDFLNHAYVVKYKARPATPDEYYEDMLKQCFYFSCELLVENNKPGIIYYFERRGYKAFLQHLPGKKEPGISSSQDSKLLAMDFLFAQIKDHINKVLFIDLVEDWLHFDVNETQKYDLSMASLWTEVACAAKFAKRQTEATKEITDYFRPNPVY